jgi:hypothetical protein
VLIIIRRFAVGLEKIRCWPGWFNHQPGFYPFIFHPSTPVRQAHPISRVRLQGCLNVLRSTAQLFHVEQSVARAAFGLRHVLAGSVHVLHSNASRTSSAPITFILLHCESPPSVSSRSKRPVVWDKHPHVRSPAVSIPRRAQLHKFRIELSRLIPPPTPVAKFAYVLVVRIFSRHFVAVLVLTTVVTSGHVRHVQCLLGQHLIIQPTHARIHNRLRASR